MNIIEKLELEWKESSIKPEAFHLTQEEYEEYAKVTRILAIVMAVNEERILYGKPLPRIPEDVEWDHMTYRKIPVLWDGKRAK